MELPLRICLTENSLHLEIGLLLGIFGEVSDDFLTITSSENFVKKYSLQDSLIENAVSWLSVGNIPAETYTLKLDSNSDAAFSFQAIGSKGTLFDGKNFRKVPPDSDVQPHKKYYLLANARPYAAFDVKIYPVISKIFPRNYRIYEVEATNFSNYAANFFRDYGYRLTPKPIAIHPLWSTFTIFIFPATRAGIFSRR